MNLAYVSPLPPLRTGVADYSATLLAHLRPHFERVVAVVDGYVPVIADGLVDEIIDGSRRRDWWGDGQTIPLYHMGCNTRYHGYVYDALRRVPGVTVLHDGNLLPLVHELTIGQGDRARFLREAAYERETNGVADGRAALREGQTLVPAQYPMIGRVALSSVGVIAHSRILADRVREAYPQARVATIPHLDLRPRNGRTDATPVLDAAPAREATGVTVGAFGFISPSKQLDAVLAAFAKLRCDFPDARFLCVGEIVSGYPFYALVRGLGLEDVVTVTGYVPADELARYLSSVDVGVNLRNPTWGESSGTLIRLMGYGVPTLVTHAGAFSELPDEAVVKVPGGPGDTVFVERALRALLGDADRRARMGAAARKYVEEACDPQGVAERYAAFIRDAVRDGIRSVAPGAVACWEGR